MRPRYGFFNQYRMASGGASHYASTSARSTARLNLLVLPELAERLSVELGLGAHGTISVRAEIRERMLVLVPSLVGTCHLHPTVRQNNVECWEVRFGPTSAGEVMSRLHFFNLL